MYFATLALFIVTGAIGLTLPFGPTAAGAMPLFERAHLLLRQMLIFPTVIEQNATLFRFPSDLFMGQMYTVGLELMFYAVAPFIVGRRLRILLPFSIVAVALHFSMQWVGPANPWQYESFPGILGFFMLGALSYRLWRWSRDKRYPKWLGWATLPVFLFFTIWPVPLQSVEFTNAIQSDAFYAGFALLLPFLFEASKNAKWDRAIGELSYPVYVVHGWIGWTFAGAPTQGVHYLSCQQARS